MEPITSQVFDKDYSKYGFHDKEDYAFKAEKGLSKELVEKISRMKDEPEWMLKFRLKSLEEFYKRPMPQWGANLNTIDFDDIYYYIKPTGRSGDSWEDVPEYIKNTFSKLGIPEAEQKFLGGVGAQYECLTGDTLVFTNPSGPKEIKSVKAGDKVFALDESTGEIKPSKVKGLMYKGARETFEVKVGTKRIKTTANHPFYALINYKKDGARRGRYRKEWRYLSDLKVGDLVGVARQIPFEGEPHAFESSHELTFRHNEVNIPKLSTDDLMWFMGLYLGDGFLHKEKNKARVEIAIPKEDIQLREALLNVVNNIFGMEASAKDKDRITIYSTILAKFIEEIGFGGKAYTKKIPQWVFSLPKTQILSFLGGYLDSDGYVRDHPKNHDVVFTSVNKKILEDTKVLTLSCGLQSSEVHEFKSKHVYDKNRHITAYRMEISGDASVILCRSEKRFLRFGKKKFYHKFNSAGNTSFRTHVNEFIGFAKIESIEPSGIKPVYDIEVENYHNFIAEGIIVHNSELVYHKIRKDLEDKGVIFLGMDDGLKQYPEIVKKYFGTVIPFNDNKLAALNSAVWSGGSFVYVPAGVKVDLPLQAYFRINAKNAGQFERTLIVAEPGASVHYIEGCFEKGAPIKTIDGIKKIEEIKEGDLVLTHKGNYKRVYKTQKRIHNDLMCTIRYKDVDIKITGGHPILSFKRINNEIHPEWVEAGKLDKNDYIGIHAGEFVLNDSHGVLVYSVKDNTANNSKLLLLQEHAPISDKLSGFCFAPIKNITKKIVTDVEVYNFSVEDDESYVAHGIVVHNCTAPVYSSDSLHSAVVELIAMEGSRIQYTTIQNWSNNVYNLVTKRAFAHKNATVFWVDGNLGCLAEGTKISTNPGLKSIEDISSGDKIISLNEQSMKLEVRKVLGTKFSGIQETYRVVLENGKREVIATKNHPFLTIDYHKQRPKKLGRYSLNWLPLANLSEGSFLVAPKEMPDLGMPYKFLSPTANRTILGRNQHGAEYFIDTSYKYKNVNIPKESDDDALWIFGMSIGDGNIEIAKNKSTQKNRFGKIIFSVPAKDLAREKLTTLMEKIFNCEKYYERKDKVTIAYNSLILAEFFKLNGIDGNAHTKSIPAWIFSLPVSQKRSFLAGYIEADGSIKGNNARLKTCNKKLLEDLKNLAISCGIEVNQIKKETETKKIHIEKLKKYNYQEKEYTCYIMHVSNLAILRKFMSKGNQDKIPKLVHEHKHYWMSDTRRIKMPGGFALYEITDIIPLGAKPTYDLEIEDSHNFVANGVLVHNSKITMKYPSIYLLGEGARAEILSVAFAGKGQHQDAGGKILHFAPNTSSRITSKSVSKDGGKTTYRGLLSVAEGCKNVKSHVTCDALILDDKSASDTVPYMEINEKDVNIEHEATVGKIGEEQLFYLMSRGLSEDQAKTMIVSGFMEPFTKELPLEYAIELNRLIALNMEGSVG